MCSSVTDRVETLESIKTLARAVVGFGIFMGFVDNKRNTEGRQPYAFQSKKNQNVYCGVNVLS